MVASAKRVLQQRGSGASRSAARMADAAARSPADAVTAPTPPTYVEGRAVVPAAVLEGDGVEGEARARVVVGQGRGQAEGQLGVIRDLSASWLLYTCRENDMLS